jgi:hypothetical protein
MNPINSNLPAEIRLQVYEELLVLSEPIKSKPTKEPSLLPLVLHKRCHLLRRLNFDTV